MASAKAPEPGTSVQVGGPPAEPPPGPPPKSAASGKTFLEHVDITATAIIKLIVLGVVATFGLMLSFCTDNTIKSNSEWLGKRLELTGFKAKKISLGIVELEAVAASTGADTANVQGLASELRTLAADKKSRGVSNELTKLASDIEAFSKLLVVRDAKLAAAVRTAAQPSATTASTASGWIYLGRRSSDGDWAPQSDKLTLDNPKSPKTLAAVTDIVIVDRDPSLPSAEAAGPKEVVRMLRAGSGAIKILRAQETPSVGSGKLVWARVDVPPAAIVEIGQPSNQ